MWLHSFSWFGLVWFDLFGWAGGSGGIATVIIIGYMMRSTLTRNPSTLIQVCSSLLWLDFVKKKKRGGGGYKFAVKDETIPTVGQR